MATNTAIPHFEPFDVHGEPTTLSLRWTRWSTRFENLMTAMNVTDVAQKKALLLHLARDALYDVYEGLVVPAVPDDADAAVVNVYTSPRTHSTTTSAQQRTLSLRSTTFASRNSIRVNLLTHIIPVSVH